MTRVILIPSKLAVRSVKIVWGTIYLGPSIGISSQFWTCMTVSGSAAGASRQAMSG